MDQPAKEVRVQIEPEERKNAHGWTADARNLVKMWAGQMALNRQKHQENADSMGAKSTNMKIVAAVFGSIATFIAFLSTTFTAEPGAIIGLNIGAGVSAAISTLVGVIAAIFALDSEAEKHRQTAIQYANVCNEAQTVLVEEHEENLPQATEFLRRMKDLTHLIQLFGPSLEASANTDMPSMILMRGIRAATGKLRPSADPTLVDEYAGIFDHGDEYSPQARKKKRADMVDDLKKDRENIKKRQAELIAEENELKALSRMLSMQADLTAAPATVSAPSVLNTQAPTAIPATAAPTAMSAPPATATAAPVATQEDTDEDEGEYTTVEDSDMVAYNAVSDRISPVIRSSLRESMMDPAKGKQRVPDSMRMQGASNLHSTYVTVGGINDNIAVDLSGVPTSGSSSRTQSGDNITEDDADAPRSLTEIALGSVRAIKHGAKKMQIAPDVLRAEIRRREDKIRAQKQELEDKRRNNSKLRREIEIARRESVIVAPPESRKTSATSLDRKGSASPPSLASVTPRQGDSPRVGVMSRIKEAFSSPPKAMSPADVEAVQQEKVQAIKELYSDDLSFECMREDI